MDFVNNDKLPKIHCFNKVTSTIDVAYDLTRQGRLEAWDSVQARAQSAGRGQMRKKWVSEEGNLFAALRLPETLPFTGTAASVVIGALCASALKTLCSPVMMKWPNDLIIQYPDGVRKVGGILVEDKPEGIIAGIGINLKIAPEITGPDSEDALAPGILRTRKKDTFLPDAWEIWRALVKHFYTLYNNGPVFNEIWQSLADELLLWQGLKVLITDDGQRHEGILIGLGDKGGALLKTAKGVQEYFNGHMRIADMAS